MAQFTLVHRGVPIGIATGDAEDADPGEPLRFSFMDFQPLDAYESVAPVIRLAARALGNLGFLGPAAEPASDAAGKAAQHAAHTLWKELEITNESGAPVAGRVVWFLEEHVEDEPFYWLNVEVDASGAAVPARLRDREVGGDAQQSPG